MNHFTQKQVVGYSEQLMKEYPEFKTEKLLKILKKLLKLASS
jgi:hypothetical protein